MMPNKFKIFIALFISVLFCIQLNNKSIGCGGFEQPDFKDYSMFAPEICGDDTLAEYFLSINNYYDNATNQEEKFPFYATNELEWWTFLGNSISNTDLYWLLYECSSADIERIQQLRNVAITKDSIIPTSLLRTKGTKEYLAFLTYLIDAKKAETFANISYYSWDRPEVDRLNTTIAIADFKKKSDSIDMPFLKERYAFQYMRAMYFNQQYKEAIAFYLDFMKKPGWNGTLQNRTCGYYAASLYKLQLYNESNLQYAKLFDECKEMRKIAFTSFHPLPFAEFKSSVDAVTDIRKKQVLWQMYGLYCSPFDAINELLKINVSSNRTMVLLMRAINILEARKMHFNDEYINMDDERLLTSNFPTRSWGSMHDNNAEQLIELIDSFKTTKGVFRPEVWKVSLAYLYYLTEQYQKAREEVKSLNAIAGIPLDIIAQSKIISALLLFKENKQLTAKQEIILLSLMEGFKPINGSITRAENAKRFILAEMSLQYQTQNKPILSELAQTREFEFYKDTNNLNEMLEMLNKGNKTAIEHYLTKNYSFKPSDLYYQKGVLSLYDHNYKLAKNYLSKSELAEQKTLIANPFSMRIKDCHDCDQAQIHSNLTIMQFCNAMDSLDQITKQKATNKQLKQAHWLMANAAYNMSYYGNGRSMFETSFFYDVNLFGRYYNDKIKEYNQYIASYLNLSMAKEHYAKSLQYSSDKEWSAKCAWGMAKCEQNEWQESDEGDGDFSAVPQFYTLQQKYSHTQFYKEVINECGYFKTFTTTNKN